MTVITAVQKGNEIAIACDTQSTSGGLKYTADYLVGHHKLIPYGDSIFGLSGSVAVHQVFEDLLSQTAPVDLSSRSEIFKWLLSQQGSLKDQYYLKTNVGSDQEQVVESSWVFGLIANPYGIFGINRYRSVLQYSKFWAIGSGGAYALGAMEILYDQDLTAGQIAEAGALTSTKFNTGCAPPVQVKVIPKAIAPSSSTQKTKRKTAQKKTAEKKTVQKKTTQSKATQSKTNQKKTTTRKKQS